MSTETHHDPLDELIPAPRSRRVRLIVGAGIVGIVGVVSLLVGFGYLYPQPDCCGSGGGSAMMTMSPDGEAVVITALFFNSSGRDLEIVSATADLPGARVLEIRFDDDLDVGPLLPFVGAALPAVIGGTSDGRFGITFVPERCDDSGEPWGTLTAELDVVNRWLPSRDRSYTLPDPVVASRLDFSVITPELEVAARSADGPLAAACELLDRD